MKSTNGGASWVFSNAGIPGGNTSGVNAIAIQTSSPSTMYISDDGALYKSTTAGSSWTSVGSGINADVDGIAIDPTTPSIVYVASDFGGVYKSTNGGGSFVAVTTGLPRNSEYNVVRVDPTTHTTVYAAGTNGIYKSINSGASWTESHNGIPFGVGVNDLAIDPANHTILLAATDNGVYRSSNSGASWAVASGGSLGNSFVVFGTGSSSGTDYAGGGGGILKSTSTGSSWTGANTSIPTLFGSPAPASALAIDPAAQANLFVGLSYPFAVYKSTNSAGSWAAASVGINQIVTDGLAVLSSTTFLVGTEGTPSSVYKTANDGASYTPSSSGIPAFAGIEEFQVISSTKVYALTFEGLYVTSNGGTSWTLVPGSSSLGGQSFAVQTNNNSHIDVLDFEGVVHVTTTGGSSWTSKTPACFPLSTFAFSSNSLAMEPSSSVNGAVGTSAGVFTTTNDWSSCTKAGGTLPFFVTGVSFDPFHPTMLWAWGFGASKATFGGSFSAVSALGSASVDDLWFNPATSGNILVGADGSGVLQSTNDGSTFTPITNSGLVAPSFTGVGKAGTTIAAALPANSVAVIVP